MIQFQCKRSQTFGRSSRRLFDNGHLSDGSSRRNPRHRTDAANLKPHIRSEGFRDANRQCANGAVQNVGDYFSIERLLSTVGPCLQDRTSGEASRFASDRQFSGYVRAEILKYLLRAAASDWCQPCQRQRRHNQVVGKPH